MPELATNVLSHGDDLDILRRHLPAAGLDRACGCIRHSTTPVTSECIGRGDLGGCDPVLGDSTERCHELRHHVQGLDAGESHAGLIGLCSSADVDVV
jgi:hypothetical protein